MFIFLLLRERSKYSWGLADENVFCEKRIGGTDVSNETNEK